MDRASSTGNRVGFRPRRIVVQGRRVGRGRGEASAARVRGVSERRSGRPLRPGRQGGSVGPLRMGARLKALRPSAIGGHLKCIGLSSGPQTLLSPDTVGELQDLRYAQIEETVRCILDNPNVYSGREDPDRHRCQRRGQCHPCAGTRPSGSGYLGSFVMVHVAQVPIPPGAGARLLVAGRYRDPRLPQRREQRHG